MFCDWFIFVSRFKKYILGTALLLPLALVAALTLIVAIETQPHGSKVKAKVCHLSKYLQITVFATFYGTI